MATLLEAVLEMNKLTTIVLSILIISFGILTSALAADCDDLAAHPDDVQKLPSVLGIKVVDHTRAIPACETALLLDKNPRNFFQLGRAYDFARDYQKAVLNYKVAAEAKYKQAMIALGSMAEAGDGMTRDNNLALKWYKAAAESGSEQGKIKFEKLSNFIRRQDERTEKLRLCDLSVVCKKYATERKSCATAGDYDKCMRIRMDSDYGRSTSLCVNDGSLHFNQPPKELECMFLRTMKFFE
jgi:hypothetical protein